MAGWTLAAAAKTILPREAKAARVAVTEITTVLTVRRPDDHINNPKKIRSTTVLANPQFSGAIDRKPRVNHKEAAAITPSIINGIKLFLAILPAFPPQVFINH